MKRRSPDIDGPRTEAHNPKAKKLDTLTAPGILRLMHSEDKKALSAVKKGLKDIARAVEDAVSAIRRGGKVVYAGAGTSGRLCVLDAAEVPPTFGSDSFRAVMAGGMGAVFRAVEGAEDDVKSGKKSASSVGASDMAVGVSASGRTPFVIAFLKEAGRRGARCWLLTCSEVSPNDFIDGTIYLPTGPEIIAGSTRLKAATATKLALNMLSTATMVRLGKVYEGLMVDVKPSNRKLIDRAERIVMAISGCTRGKASDMLKRSGMRPKVASLMTLKGISKKQAEKMLEISGGSLRQALKG